MKVVWTNEALREVEAIVVYIAHDNVPAALTLGDAIVDSVEKVLSHNPMAGRPGRVDGTRELIVHASYLVAYRMTRTSVEVLTVRHTARLWPDTL